MSSMSTPPLSVEELDKRIADLKAVESWLNVNVAMLRGTIQTMEVQRATLSTLKSMGASMAEAMRQSGVSAEKMAGTPFGAFFGQPASGAAAPSAAAAGAGGGGTAQPGTGAPAHDPAAALGMPTALAWWNMLQEQFTQAVATAMAPTDGAARTEPKKDVQAPPQAEPGGGGGGAAGNGKARAGKPKADKA
jgi:class 3 adenylate cyclase